MTTINAPKNMPIQYLKVVVIQQGRGNVWGLSVRGHGKGACREGGGEGRGGRLCQYPYYHITPNLSLAHEALLPVNTIFKEVLTS